MPNQTRIKESVLNKYNTLIDFVRKNKRLPSAKNKEERRLYQFLYLQRKLFEKDELENIIRDKFLIIAKELQNIQYENKKS